MKRSDARKRTDATPPGEHRIIGYVLTHGGRAELVRDVLNAEARPVTWGVPDGSMLICIEKPA